MSAAEYDITIEQGASFSLAVTWQDENESPVDLTGFTAAAQVRETFDSEDAALSFDVSLGGTAGTISLTADPSATAEVDFPERGVWDLELTNAGGTVTRLLQGRATAAPEVTR